MGVNGLLPSLQSISYQVSLEKYHGLTVGVDAMCWLHKAVYASDPVALAKSQYRTLDQNATNERISRRLNFDISSSKDEIKSSTTSNANRLCAEYVIKQVEVLMNQYNMTVILVIDGAPLPIKRNVNKKRVDHRVRMFHEAIQAEKKGDSKTARKLFAQSCSVSYDIKYELIELCRKLGIAFIVAPYEADAQIAKLAHTSYVDLVITEDSDLLLYGCPRVLFKIDLYTGTGIEVQILRDLGNNEKLSFQNWTHDMFIYMCILSGCDYCDGISGLGLQTAHKLVRVHRTPQKIFKALKSDGRLNQDFEQLFWMAFKTFRHQRVYCLQKDELDFLFPLEQIDWGVENWDFLGYWLEPETVRDIACGMRHPESKAPWISKNESHYIRTRSSELDQVGHSVEDNNVNFSFFSRKRKIERSPDLDSSHQANCIHQGTYALKDNLIIDESINGFNQPARIGDGFFHTSLLSSRVPIHFEDYTSNLIGASFETLSRSLRRNNTGKRVDILNALETLRCKQVSQIPYKQSHPQQFRTHCDRMTSNHQEIASHEIQEIKANKGYELAPDYSHFNQAQRSNSSSNKSDEYLQFCSPNNFSIDDFHDHQYLMDLLCQQVEYHAADSISVVDGKDISHYYANSCEKRSLPQISFFHSEYESRDLSNEFNSASPFTQYDIKSKSLHRSIVDKTFLLDLKRLIDL